MGKVIVFAAISLVFISASVVLGKYIMGRMSAGSMSGLEAGLACAFVATAVGLALAGLGVFYNRKSKHVMM